MVFVHETLLKMDVLSRQTRLLCDGKLFLLNVRGVASCAHELVVCKCVGNSVHMGTCVRA